MSAFTTISRESGRQVTLTVCTASRSSAGASASARAPNLELWLCARCGIRWDACCLRSCDDGNANEDWSPAKRQTHTNKVSIYVSKTHQTACDCRGSPLSLSAARSTGAFLFFQLASSPESTYPLISLQLVPRSLLTYRVGVRTPARDWLLWKVTINLLFTKDESICLKQ